MSLIPKQEQRQELRQVPVFIGISLEAERVREFASKAAKTEHTVLLRGETGVGKDHIAEWIHYSGRPNRPFVPVDCGSMTESLSETELFGHTQGAFTDAREQKLGLVRFAEEGTLFFNEVANMSMSMQAKFLRVLEKQSYRPVGGTGNIEMNTRIIAATNANLEDAVKKGQIRLDLFYRLNTITLTVAPLRERIQDVPLLADYFLRQETGSKYFSKEAMAFMLEYQWPGNVRELKNAVVRGAFSSLADKKIEIEHLNLSGINVPGIGVVNVNRELPTFYEHQRNYLIKLLKKTGGNIKRASEIAEIKRTTLIEMVKRFQLKEFADSLRKPKEDMSEN